ncbi:Unconventional prefoldin RPB5 interactor [Fukomys damarensis]|uniref:Unconventional prefoldin RPB5 interactor n=1 Tax=Fukomys damarensis TaxID=885580 RepID=A0A091DT54_FUKDA|nr:Unconventional prefoldin RPB5 interactor [Fukomys damarensis]
MSDAAGDIVDIREEIKTDFEFKGKQRIAHKPHYKPKTSAIFEADFVDVKSQDFLADKELWARLEELDRQEELLGELDCDYKWKRHSNLSWGERRSKRKLECDAPSNSLLCSQLLP